MTAAVIVAAGSGRRLGAEQPKALVEVAGRPMLQWSVEALRAVPGVARVIVVLPPGVQVPDGTIGVEGGRVRSDSVRRGLAMAGDEEIVLVHDAARPLVTTALALAVIDALLADPGADAAIAAVPVTDTIKRVGDGHTVAETLHRGELWAVQTPQVFRRAPLERALDVDEAALARATDDASLVESAGGRVIVVAAERENLKVTTPHDLRVAELLLGARAGDAA